MKTEIFTPVLAWLDQNAPHYGFHMGHFQTPEADDYAGHPCGTVMCLAGAVAQFNNIAFPPDLLVFQLVEIVRDHIGMTEAQSEQLFYATDDDDPGSLVGGSLKNITPTRAAATLRHFIATGEVQWTL